MVLRTRESAVGDVYRGFNLRARESSIGPVLPWVLKTRRVLLVMFTVVLKGQGKVALVQFYRGF